MNNISKNELEESGSIPLDDYRQNIERIVELAEYPLETEADLLTRLEEATAHLLIDRQQLISIATALIAGHLVLQGPPGTGKSSMVRAIAQAFNCELFPVTAHEEWSSYDVVGRQTLTYNNEAKEEITPVNGYFTEAVIRCANSISKHFDTPENPQASWLFIDEMNRCQIDRAFGELFSVLGSGEPVSVILSHQTEGNRLLTTPGRFRVIGTINSIDKQFVNSLSQAIRRRFTFITIDIPAKRDADEVWTYQGSTKSLAVKEFNIVIDQAISRLTKRLEGSRTQEEITKFYTETAINKIGSLFSLAEKVRYSTQESGLPYLPIGTAQMIDTVELFGTFYFSFSNSGIAEDEMIDWAASVKLAPLFEADTINATILDSFADEITAPFDKKTKDEIKKIAAAGMYFIG